VQPQEAPGRRRDAESYTVTGSETSVSAQVPGGHFQTRDAPEFTVKPVIYIMVNIGAQGLSGSKYNSTFKTSSSIKSLLDGQLVRVGFLL